MKNVNIEFASVVLNESNTYVNNIPVLTPKLDVGAVVVSHDFLKKLMEQLNTAHYNDIRNQLLEEVQHTHSLDKMNDVLRKHLLFYDTIVLIDEYSSNHLVGADEEGAELTH